MSDDRMAPRLGTGGGMRDPFLGVTGDAARVRSRLKEALEAIVPRGASFRISNLIVQNGKVDEHGIVIEVRETSLFHSVHVNLRKSGRTTDAAHRPSEVECAASFSLSGRTVEVAVKVIPDGGGGREGNGARRERRNSKPGR